MTSSTEVVSAVAPARRRVASADAIEAVYRAQAPRLQRLAAAVAGADMAGDVVQDAFALALRRRGSWRGDGPLEAWLWRLVLNAARDAERKRVRRQRLVTRVTRLFDAGTASEVTVDSTLHGPLRRLPARQRDCVVLRYYGDLSYAEIAGVMGIEVGTVGALLSKAHAALRAEIERGAPVTVFDPQTDRYLERLAEPGPGADWDDVLRRAHGARRGRVAGVGAVAVAAGGIALIAIAPSTDVGGRSIVDKAEAAALAPLRAADGTVEHISVAYRTGSGHVFIEYETWIAADGGWCRRTVEGLPDGSAPDTRLTECHAPDGTVELYLPATGEILRAGPGAPQSAERGSAAPRPDGTGKGKLKFQISPDGKVVVKRGGRTLTAAEVDALAAQQRDRSEGRQAECSAPDWLREDVVDAFRRDAVREAGTMTLDGRVYTKLVTADGRNTVLVDPATGEGVAWIPSPEAFGVPTTVVRTRQTLPDDDATRRSLSLPALHPDAAIREVSPAELEQAKAAQYPRG